MSYNHSDPFYWNHVVNVGGFTTPGGLWESVSVNNATQWAIWYLGGPSSGQYIYSIPGCSPQDFSFGGQALDAGLSKLLRAFDVVLRLKFPLL